MIFFLLLRPRYGGRDTFIYCLLYFLLFLLDLPNGFRERLLRSLIPIFASDHNLRQLLRTTLLKPSLLAAGSYN